MDEFDYIVVGAGSAGSRRRQPADRGPGRSGSCCSRPADPDIPPNVDDASVWYTLLGLGRRLEATSASRSRGSTAARPSSRAASCPAASSNLYIMMHIRGHTLGLRRLGLPAARPAGRTRTSCRTSRSWRARRTTPATWAGHGGPLPLTNAGKHDPNPTSQAFLEACVELGYPSTDDFNGPNMDRAPAGTTSTSSTASGLARYHAYLEPALKRPEPDVRHRAPWPSQAHHRGRALHRRRVRQRPASTRCGPTRRREVDRLRRRHRVAQAPAAVGHRRSGRS